MVLMEANEEPVIEMITGYDFIIADEKLSMQPIYTLVGAKAPPLVLIVMIPLELAEKCVAEAAVSSAEL